MKSEFKKMEHYVAIDSYCAWPNLTHLKDGAVGSLVFNKPSHGGVEGDIEFWTSKDGGMPWVKRSIVTHHEPGTVRMNVSGGMNGDGTFIALVSGWQLEQRKPIRTDNILEDIWVCRSKDSGYTWGISKTFHPLKGAGRFIPFGNIIEGDKGELVSAAYDCRMADESRESRKSSSFIFKSVDNGIDWGKEKLIGADAFTETDILRTKDGCWIAAVRTLSDYAHPDNPHSSPWVTLFRSNRDGAGWEEETYLTLPGQHPGNLLRLTDGRILFTCGNRIPGNYGIFSRVSEDEGKSWSQPLILINDLTSGDCGYPSTIQLDDGALVTAYYAKEAEYHYNYHMAVLRWKLL